MFFFHGVAQTMLGYFQAENADEAGRSSGNDNGISYFNVVLIPHDTSKSNIRLLVTAMLRILSNFGLASLSVRLWIPIRWVKMSNNL